MHKVKRLCYNKSMKKNFRGGFTLIELSLSLIFIAILSLMLVFLINNTSASYRRGLTLNQVNSVGMDLVDDFRISIQNATSDPVTRMCEIYYKPNSTDRTKCEEDGGYSFVYFAKMANVTSDGQNYGSMPVYGAICTGTYTYIWNSGYFEDVSAMGNTGMVNKRTVSGTSRARLGVKRNYRWEEVVTSRDKSGNPIPIRLVKVYDDERSVCVNVMKSQGSGYTKLENYQQSRIPTQLEIASSMIDNDREDIAEMMTGNDSSDLVLYDLYVARPALSQTRLNLFYSASFILGTRRGGINIKQAGTTCKPPSNEFSELEYCAINKFNFAVMAGGS